ncbi:hypothetical protein V6N12_066576 [Hibiscus sabdariffa]|uniref:Uncharacterized protein n=1 Tax=Hibiscus sabdariffa TaxID=183260 RepID=A0ABR2CS86_9ROSI
MGKLGFLSSVLSYRLLRLVSILIVLNIVAYGDETKDFYIVYLGDSPVSKQSAVEKHIGLLSSVKGSEHGAKESIVYSYTKSFNAFDAKLSNDEAEMLKGLDDVASVFRNRYHELHTTKSWDFIGLPVTARRNLKLERNIVVGLLDTGITPQSESFKDDGFGPPPSKWKGTCHHFVNFSGCNNKIIGAKYYKLDGNSDPADILSPIDMDGHGTYTSSTLAGNEGPSLTSVSNYFLWLLTAAASGIDRKFMSTVKLGNEKSYSVKGRLVYCTLSQWGVDSVVKGIGGIGTIVESEQYLDTAQIFMAPATMVNSTVGKTIQNYIHSTSSPSAVVYKSEEVKIFAPFVASFSSRGPNPGSRHILKPDITAPGVDILAAYSYKVAHRAQSYDALNYPSMQLNMKEGQQQTIGIFRRRVTNVGPPSVYNATIKATKGVQITVRATKGVQITVRPMSLLFTRQLQKRSFKVMVRANYTASSKFTVLSASLVWRSSRYTLRSPIVVYNLPD